MRAVDEGVRKTVQLFEEVFKDNKTAFLFTSDHGMSNKGMRTSIINCRLRSYLLNN